MAERITEVKNRFVAMFDIRIQPSVFCFNPRTAPSGPGSFPISHRIDTEMKPIWQQIFDSSRLHVPVIFVLGLLIFFPLLGARDFWDHENEYAEITRVMLLDGNYMLPVFNGAPWGDRPIFSFWLALAVSWLAGEVNEWTVRLPSAVSAMVLMLVYYHFLKKHFDPRAAFLSTVVVASSLLTVHVERHLPANMLCFLLLVLSMFLFMEVLVFESKRPLHIYGAWLTLGLACLTKGPLVILFPAAVISLYLAQSCGWEKAWNLRPLTGTGVLLVIAVPWFAWAAWNTGGAWTRAFITHHYFWRYTGPASQDSGSFLVHAVSYLGFHLPVGFLPWTFLAVPAAISLWPERAKLGQGAMLFFALWAISILFISTFSDWHHGHDLFLILPLLALAAGSYLNRLLSTPLNDRVWAWTKRFTIASCLLLIGMGASGPIVAALQFHWTRPAIVGLAVIGVALIAIAAWLFWAAKEQNYHLLISGFVALMIASNTLIHIFVFPAFNKLKVRSFAERMGRLVEPGSEVGFYKSAMSYKFNFYSRIKRIEKLDYPGDIETFVDRNGPRYILARERFLNEIRAVSQNKVQLVLAETVGRDRWVLLSSCKQGCSQVDFK